MSDLDPLTAVNTAGAELPLAPSVHPGGLTVNPPEVVSMRTADGLRLDADVWRPQGEGPWPVLLQRQAYGRRIACTICYAHPAWYAAQGYLVVVQDVRGRGTSEGEFDPGRHEAADGAQAVEWAARLPGSDGRVAMYGFSYQAYGQLLAATQDCPSLAALIPAMGPWDMGRNWVYQGGAFCLEQMAIWGAQVLAEGARRDGRVEDYTRLKGGIGGLFSGESSALPDALMSAGGYGHYAEWVNRPADDPHWAGISPSTWAKEIARKNLPMLFIGGWFDAHFSSTFNAFRALDRAGDPTLRLMVGPWLHFPWTRRVAGQDFGPEAAPDLDRIQVDFLDAVLKGKGSLEAADRVSLFDMGARRWCAYDGFPEAKSDVYLSGGGRAATCLTDGGFADAPAAGTEFLVHDPWRPAPAAGPANGSVPGPSDRSLVDERGDVMTFTSVPQTAPVQLSGAVSLSLRMNADRPSFDVSATLSLVGTDGAVHPVAAGYLHLPAGGDRPVFSLPLGATCLTLQPGEALRLSLAASDFPAHPVNPGTGENPRLATQASALVTTLQLFLGADTRLEVPVADGHLTFDPSQ